MWGSHIKARLLWSTKQAVYKLISVNREDLFVQKKKFLQRVKADTVDCEANRTKWKANRTKRLSSAAETLRRNFLLWKLSDSRIEDFMQIDFQFFARFIVVPNSAERKQIFLLRCFCSLSCLETSVCRYFEEAPRVLNSRYLLKKFAKVLWIMLGDRVMLRPFCSLGLDAEGQVYKEFSQEMEIKSCWKFPATCLFLDFK